MTTNVMLAHSYEDDKHSKQVIGWWMSEKYDGVRAKWNGKEMESRTGIVYNIPEFLKDQLKLIVCKDGNPIELDGELWGGYDTFAHTSGLARRIESNCDAWKNITYMIFDSPDANLPFEERYAKIKESLHELENENIKLIVCTKYTGEQSIECLLKEVEAKKGEGIMLRKPGSKYDFKRSRNLLKVKSFSCNEAHVYGYEAGKTGRTLGLVGSLLVVCKELGEKPVKFKVGSGLTDVQRNTGSMKDDLACIKKWSESTQKEIDIQRIKINEIQMGERLPVIGDIITFKYKELTKSGNPSMPTFVAVRDYE